MGYGGDRRRNHGPSRSGSLKGLQEERNVCARKERANGSSVSQKKKTQNGADLRLGMGRPPRIG
jgi:hypothetical protein